MEGPDAEAHLTLAEAVQHIDKATSFAEPLRRRAEGVTIAVWGFVSACVVLSNGMLDDVYGFWDAGGWRRMVSSLLWIPWAGIGVLTTMAIWRIAEVSARRPIPGLRRSPVAILTWLAFLLAAILVIGFAIPVGAAGVAIVAVGIAWTAVGALDLYKATPSGRRAIVGVGIVIALAGAAYGLATAGTAHDGWDGFEPAAVLTMGLVPILVGLTLTLRR